MAETSVQLTVLLQSSYLSTFTSSFFNRLVYNMAINLQLFGTSSIILWTSHFRLSTAPNPELSGTQSQSWPKNIFQSIYFVVVLVYSCRIRNDFHPKKSIIRRIGSLFLVLAACNNVNLNMALFGFKMIPFIREIRNTFEIHLAKKSKARIIQLLKVFSSI